MSSLSRSPARSVSSYSVSRSEAPESEVETVESSLCESFSDLTTSDTFSEIQPNAYWNESDFCLDFLDPETDHDRILLVGGKDIHVISQFLMESSDFFKVLFGENFIENSQEKIELKDVETEDFIEFLNHLYSNNRKITKDNFFTLYTLADRYLTSFLFEKCNDFIKENPEMINDFGQRAFDLLKMAIDMDLKDIKKILQQEIFASSRAVLCQKCQRLGMYHSIHFGLYLANGHICWEHRDYIMTLEPKMITFILSALINGEEPSEEGKPVKSMNCTKKEVANKKLLIYNFANKGPNYDSTIIVKDLQNNKEEIFNVNAKIVCYGAKWFRGRLEKGSHLVLTDVSPAYFELYLNYIYPNAHPVSLDSCLPALLEMAVRFESPWLNKKIFDELNKATNKEFLEELTDETVELIEIAMKYDLREVKKLFYKHLIEPCAKMTDMNRNCPATEEFMKHKFKPDGVFNSLERIIPIRNVCNESPDVQRFILSCLLKNVSKCL